MITPMPWASVPAGAKVILDSGRIVHVLNHIAGTPVVVLRDDFGRTRLHSPDPAQVVPVVFDEELEALASLRVVFPSTEFLRRA